MNSEIIFNFWCVIDVLMLMGFANSLLKNNYFSGGKIFNILILKNFHYSNNNVLFSSNNRISQTCLRKINLSSKTQLLFLFTSFFISNMHNYPWIIMNTHLMFPFLNSFMRKFNKLSFEKSIFYSHSHNNNIIDFFCYFLETD